MLLVEDEPYMADAIRDGLRLEAIAADIAADGDTALELLRVNAYDIAVLDRDIPGPSGDEIAERVVASGTGMPILMLTAADRLDDKATGFELGADALGRIKVCVTRVFGRNIVKLCCQGSRSVGVPAGVRSAGRMDSRRPDARTTHPDRRRGTDDRARITVPPDPATGPQG